MGVLLHSTTPVNVHIRSFKLTGIVVINSIISWWFMLIRTYLGNGNFIVLWKLPRFRLFGDGVAPEEREM